MAALYRIGEFSNLSGVSAKTLRFYDEIGLFRPASVDARTGYRQYRPQQLEELASILALKGLGVPLTTVRSLLSRTGSGVDRRDLLSEVKRTIEQSIRTAARSLKYVDAILDQLEVSKHPISVVVRRRAAAPIASVRAKLEDYADVVKVEQELLRVLPPECVGSLRGVLWHRCADSGSLEAEPFCGLKRKVPFRSFYAVKELPAATVACAYSEWDDDSAEQGYVAIRRWMNAMGYQLAGAKREIYLDQMLEIQFPIKSA
jgi:DNA-binding transcriptional MerR regulator